MHTYLYMCIFYSKRQNTTDCTRNIHKSSRRSKNTTIQKKNTLRPLCGKRPRYAYYTCKSKCKRHVYLYVDVYICICVHICVDHTQFSHIYGMYFYILMYTFVHVYVYIDVYICPYMCRSHKACISIH